MKNKDRLVIILSIIVVMLFAIEIAGNIKEALIREGTENGFSRSMPEILGGLEKAGLEPREAKYYEEIR